ncbi:hypothetical protein B0H14DRAFT_3153380 [Mycena olivaceomarginata]|nr:hypothetical protein B0H14DRAFT_3153380 [Mycena olivaceomarginata]
MGTVFRPFLQFPELFPLPFPDGDSPLDFLANPQRARRLYSEPSSIAEGLVLRWIGHARRTLAGGPCELYPYHLKTFEKCGTSQRLLHEFATFNLSNLCHQMAIDVEAHEDFHRYIVSESALRAVLDWLRSFPDDPLLRQVLAFWEIQVHKDIKGGSRKLMISGQHEDVRRAKRKEMEKTKFIAVEFGHTLSGSKIPQQTKIVDRSACHQEQPQRGEIMLQDLSTKLVV